MTAAYLGSIFPILTSRVLRRAFVAVFLLSSIVAAEFGGVEYLDGCMPAQERFRT